MLFNKVMSKKDFVKNVMSYNEAQNEASRSDKHSTKVANDLLNEQTTDVYQNMQGYSKRKQNLNNFSESVKTTFLAESIFKIYNESLDVLKKNKDYTRSLGMSLITNFINEQGVDSLLNKFKTKNLLLSEMYSRVMKYHKLVMEAVDKEDNMDELSIDPVIRDDFFNDLNMTDPDNVVTHIRQRVTDAVEEFIDKNIENKVEIKDIIQAVQDKVNSAKMDEVKESYNIIGKRAINNVMNKPKNVFHCMVSSVYECVLKNDQLKEQYYKDGKIDKDRLVENTELIYSLLETLNTTCMVDVDANYIKEVLFDLKS